MSKPPYKTPYYIDEPMDEYIILERLPNGNVYTNVPWLVKHHSPTGFEWGYGGSGPADLALNILENLLRMVGYEGEQLEMRDGRRAFLVAWKLHQLFKSQVIAALHRDTGVQHLYTNRIIADWLKDYNP